MIIVLKPGSSDADVEDVSRRVRAAGFSTHLSRREARAVIGIVGDDSAKDQFLSLQSLHCVEQAVRIRQPFKLASREAHPDDTRFEVNGVPIGGPQIAVMAGPCSVESRPQLMAVAEGVKRAGAHILRGGAFKPRTSPYAFQGLEERGLELLREASKATGLPVVTEVMEADKVDVIAEHADVVQIGARNVQNFALLKRVAECGKPVLLKRGMSTSIQEWLLSAEYILAGGNPNVMLCERGIRTFETATRFTLDLNAIPVAKKLSHLPVLVDPSHGTGHWEFVAAMAKAALAAGADGLIIEVHDDPAHALSDGPQSLKPDRFATLMTELRPLARVLGRTL
jgi:3-deoxy-7-phosphoheptulonate synthase